MPLVAMLVLLAYVRTDYPWMMGLSVALLLLQLLWAAYGIRRFVFRIKQVSNALSGSLPGHWLQKKDPDGQDEIAELMKATHGITHSLAHKNEFVVQMGAGNMQCDFQALGEGDQLGHSLLRLKERLIILETEEKERKWTTDGLAMFVEILRSSKNLKELSNAFICQLVPLLKACQGAIFVHVRNEEKEYLEMQACYAYQRTKYLTKRIEIGEGLIGQAFLEKESTYLKAVPNDFVRITSGLGEANPRNILIVPLKANDEVVGVTEIASFQEWKAHEMAFVEKIAENIAHAIISFRITDTTQHLLRESQTQAEQMRAQEEELLQNQEELQATQEEISRKYRDLFKQLRELNHQSRFDQLRSINSTKKRNLEYYFDIIRNQILTLAENRMIVEAVREFRTAFAEVENHMEADQLSDLRQSLSAYYEQEFIPRLNEDADHLESVEHYLPEQAQVMALQHAYIAANPHPTGQKSLLDDAGDGSPYSRVHARYHPIMRSFLEKFGYYDIFLIDSQTGDMLYSVFKEVDFATNLNNGLYAGTNFGRVVQEAIRTEDRHFVKLIDFEPYDPSYRAPASFIACPVYDGDEKVGVLVFQMPIIKINQILTGDQKWREDGLGDSGETVVVGCDYKLRSIARELVENQESYLSRLKTLGYKDELVQQIRKSGTSILLEEWRQESVSRALEGGSGLHLEPDSRGDLSLYAFAPLNIADVQWVILSRMREEEVSSRINRLQETE